MNEVELMLRQAMCQQQEMSTGQALIIISDYIYVMKGIRVTVVPKPSELDLFEKATTIACGFFCKPRHPIIFEPKVIMHKLEDQSPRTGVFVGDLKYGRTNQGVVDKHGDFAGPDNAPVVPLVLVEPRDRSIWTKDERVRHAKRITFPAGELTDTTLHLMEIVRKDGRKLRANFHLTVGKTRL